MAATALMCALARVSVEGAMPMLISKGFTIIVVIIITNPMI
jgi:hypothetical protein